MPRSLRSVPLRLSPSEPVSEVIEAQERIHTDMSPQPVTMTRPWRLALALVVSAILWLLAWYGETVQTIVEIWIRSETFTHGFLIIPIAAWLVWRRRHAVAAINPQPNLRVLLFLAVTGFAWLIGELASVGVVQQFALASMIPLVVWTVLGNRVVWALLFPLAYLLFAVPFGEFLVPSLMTHTADFTAVALRLSGIPVYREGQLLMIPSGNWSVVEACGGLRYLIASLTLGVLYAYLMYRSILRRALFVAVSIIVPIVANWIRAYLIVMIGHLSDMKYAVGVDHLIYGWLFFGLVTLLLLWIGSYWREDLPGGSPAMSMRSGPPAASCPLGGIVVATIAAVMVAGAWPVAASLLRESGGPAMPMLQEPVVSGWQRVEPRLANWAPHFENPASRFSGTYASDSARVGLYIGYYSRQRQGAELITSQNALVHTSNAAWIKAAEARREHARGSEPPMLEARLAGRNTNLLVWYWYWVDGDYTANSYWAKLLQAKSQLLGRGDDGAVIIIYTESDTRGEAARAALQSFVSAALASITKVLANAR